MWKQRHTKKTTADFFRNDFNVGPTWDVRQISVRDCTSRRSPTLVMRLTLGFSQRMARLFVTTLRSEGSSYAPITPSNPPCPLYIISCSESCCKGPYSASALSSLEHILRIKFCMCMHIGNQSSVVNCQISFN